MIKNHFQLFISKDSFCCYYLLCNQQNYLPQQQMLNIECSSNVFEVIEALKRLANLLFQPQVQLYRQL